MFVMNNNQSGDTLFVTFMKEKIRRHNAPVGKSISKNAGGFTMGKYKSLLLSLLSFPYKEIAGMLDISYAGLRFWRNDEHYLKSIDALTEEFAVQVIDHVIALTKDSAVRNQCDAEELIGFACETSVFNVFWDIPIYSDALMNAIYNKAKETIYAERLPRELWLSFYNHLGYVFGMRKGYIRYREIIRDDTVNSTRDDDTVDGGLMPPENSPIVEEYSNGLTLFTFVDIFEKPWKATPDVIERVTSRFAEQIRNLL